ncbi:hypothetical protein COW81_01435 [Candidatus Campbellbacteria bacterium CG22_combo_CG10-13_8_21_14_all_36_13]|uniref:pyruvate kinase n=1 Tax=Candidatus Campbellbacteria bacterium CG22_combo_CG10-13_8_21_14_all_36_13 TaxID=1974529 RepID=A0A2H0E049_9BACT|nr:MAG: hypothetical protein COW81_01435 [Candidatus Campbellbacteria bacterium CG22_combo_CG10-13_8_21_14_all_36_13]
MSSETQIVATIGPASRDKDVLAKMIESGMDLARINFSWGTHNEHKNSIELIRSIAKEKGIRIPIIQDLSGPRDSDESGHRFDTKSSSVITEKDLDDLDFGVSMNVEYVALSFVGSPGDVDDLRSLIIKRGGNAKIIAKIERQIAVDGAEEIIKSSDAVMIARGDLGNEIPLEQIPFVQEKLISIANKYKKPVIVATGMMTSMLNSDSPSRADITDVVIAVLENADAVMLSEETATGDFPVETVSFMEKALREAELRKEKTGLNLF